MSWTRVCPHCGETMTYVNKRGMTAAANKNTGCTPCRNKRNSGAGNYFYKKKHTPETRSKIRAADQSYKKTEAFRESIKRGMIGKKCGGDCRKFWSHLSAEVQAEKAAKRNASISRATSGKNNPMYGRPSPNGSGNGWSGWYKGWYFRSLRELSFVITFVEVGGHSWRTGETSDMRTRYIDPLGRERTYAPDFVVDELWLVECKPRRLWDSPSVKAKSVAGAALAKSIGMAYLLVDPNTLSDEEIRELHDSGKIKFTDRYEQKYRERYL